MHFADSIIIFIIALILFGPKKLPEIGRQIGKLLAEFRRASNDFKLQIDEELRNMEQQDRQKRLEEATAKATAEMAAYDAKVSEEQAQLTTGTESPSASAQAANLEVKPPSTGETVSTEAPHTAVNAEKPAEAPQTAETEAVKTEPESEQAPIHG